MYLRALTVWKRASSAELLGQGLLTAGQVECTRPWTCNWAHSARSRVEGPDFSPEQGQTQMGLLQKPSHHV